MLMLPTEILEEIIDIISQNDEYFSSTKKCSLVCREFLPICRKRIFASVALTYHVGRAVKRFQVRTQRMTPDKFTKLFASAPEIADYVRDFRLDGGVADSPSIVQSLTRITRLRRLTFVGFGSTSTIEWKTDAALRPVFLHLSHLSTLVSLTIYSVREFALADLPPKIPALHFEDTTFDRTPSSLPSSSIALRTLTIKDGSGSMISQLPAVQSADGKLVIEFDGILHLFLQLGHPQPRKIEGVLHLLALCKNLVRVKIKANPHRSTVLFEGLYDALSPSLPSLRHLNLEAVLAPNDDVDPYHGIIDEIAKMGNRNVIETITINMNIPSRLQQIYRDECRRFDEVLTETSWPYLKRVVLNIFSTRIVFRENENHDNQKRLTNYLLTQFRVLSLRESLDFTVKVYTDDM
ncbi:hypothetical protein BDN70DRAFT_929594 [Pholiota conissans]|uniref:F-box domain-containing protein n=1 Tax=Pholiota conissans TaxID=109636 RepID=A0A9P5ZA37_9AGAR|nr:hypothetical protein BDN70DRAFT_929594 [Pholiota conissans]